MTVYLSVEQLILINVEMIKEWGGIAGVRDRRALEAAVPRPLSGYYADDIERAAALCESLLQNHPFIDGNKRSAITATGVFLRMNDYELIFVDREMYTWLMNLYETNRVTKAAIEVWLRTHAISI
jgi:death-on-curing protein